MWQCFFVTHFGILCLPLSVMHVCSFLPRLHTIDERPYGLYCVFPSGGFVQVNRGHVERVSKIYQRRIDPKTTEGHKTWRCLGSASPPCVCFRRKSWSVLIAMLKKISNLSSDANFKKDQLQPCSSIAQRLFFHVMISLAIVILD